MGNFSKNGNKGLGFSHAHHRVPSKRENPQLFKKYLELQPLTTTNDQQPVDKMASRPTVTIATADGKPSGATLPLPAVFESPIRPDIVQ